MPRFARACFLCLCLMSTATLIGCGGPPTLSDSGPPPPHGGNLVRLPANAGYVEVVKKPSSSASAKTPMAGEVSFYFLKDASTPISPSALRGNPHGRQEESHAQARGRRTRDSRRAAAIPQGRC